MKLQNKIIYILSPEHFGEALLSKHHYALQLSENNNVFFISQRKNIPNKIEINKINENLTEIIFQNNFRGLHILPKFFVKLLFKKKIRKIKKVINHNPDVIFTFNPYLFWWIKDFGAKISIFMLVDWIELIGKIPFKILGEQSDSVITVSRKIAEYYEIKNYIEINHGVPNTVIKSLENEKSTFSEKLSTVGFFGNIRTSKIDWKNTFLLIEKYPDVTFYFIGPYEKSNVGGKLPQDTYISQLKSHPNVILTGPLTGKDVFTAFKKINAFIFPCIESNPLWTCNSLKFGWYLATGKPIVCSYVDFYRNISDNLIIMAKDGKTFVDCFMEVYNNFSTFNSPENQKKRMFLAKENTYDKHIERIENILTKIELRNG